MLGLHPTAPIFTMRLRLILIRTLNAEMCRLTSYSQMKQNSNGDIYDLIQLKEWETSDFHSFIMDLSLPPFFKANVPILINNNDKRTTCSRFQNFICPFKS